MNSTVKERPILFSAPMVRALLAGEKTQTRRAVKLTHDSPLGVWEPTTFGPGTDARGREHDEQVAIWHTRTGDCIGCPFGIPGERLWVRECFAAWWDRDTGKRTHVMGFRADIDDPDWDGGFAEDPWWLDAKWEPSIHMPRWACRIELEITNVRVERLQDISAEDVLAEGIRIPVAQDGGGVLLEMGSRFAPSKYLPKEDGVVVFNPRRAGKITGFNYAMLRAHYASLWDTLAKAESWETNPWVWVIEFRRVKP